MITFHPVTLEKSERGDQINDLLEALNKLKDTTLIFTMPNALILGIILFMKKYKKVLRNKIIIVSYLSLLGGRFIKNLFDM